jgi:hypothetical protein
MHEQRSTNADTANAHSWFIDSKRVKELTLIAERQNSSSVIQAEVEH